jgi:hypothetical protein
MRRALNQEPYKVCYGCEDLLCLSLKEKLFPCPSPVAEDSGGNIIFFERDIALPAGHGHRCL